MLRACWQGTVALLLVWAISLVFRRLSPALKCWLWRAAFLKLLLAFVWNGHFDLPLLSRAPIRSHPAQPVAAGLHPAPFSPTLASQPAPTDLATKLSAVNSIPGLHALLAAFWAGGVLLMVARLGWDWRRTCNLRRASARSTPGLMITNLQEAAEKFSVKPPELLFSDRPNPMLVGMVKPALLIPASLSADAAPLVFAHELAHLKRRDLFWNWLPAAARVLFWFHPAVLLAVREATLAQEMACDEMAVHKTSTPIKRYATLLLELSSPATAEKPSPLIAVAIFGSKKSLERRLKAMKYVEIPRRRFATLTVLLLAVATLAIIPWRLVAEKADSAVSAAVEPGAEQAPPQKRETELSPSERKQRELCRKEIDLAEQQLKFIQRQHQNGQAGTERVIEQQRDLARLFQELAVLEGDSTAWKTSLEQELGLIEQLLKEQKKRVEIGAAPADAILKTERDQLRVQRELAALEEQPLRKPDPQDLDAKLSALHTRERELLTQYTEHHPSVQQVRKEIAEIERLATLRAPSATDPALGAMGVQRKFREERSQRDVNARKQMDTISLSPARSGIIKALLVKPGDRVKENQLLIQLDSRDAEARLDIATAQVKMAATSTKLQKLKLAEATSEQERKNQLFKQKLISEAEVGHEVEKQALELERAALEQEVAQARLHQAQVEVDLYAIRAPTAGTITSVEAHVGEAVGTTPPRSIVSIQPDKTASETTSLRAR